MSSHIMQEVVALADRVVIVAEGRAVASGSVESVVAGAGASSLEDAFFRLTEKAAQERHGAAHDVAHHSAQDAADEGSR